MSESVFFTGIPPERIDEVERIVDAAGLKDYADFHEDLGKTGETVEFFVAVNGGRMAVDILTRALAAAGLPVNIQT